MTAAEQRTSFAGWAVVELMGHRQYTCIRGDDGDTWQCAPLVVDVSAEARP